MSHCVVRTQLERTSHLLAGIHWFVAGGMNGTERDVSVCQIVLQRQSLTGVLFRQVQVPLCTPAHRVAISQSGIGCREARILPRGLLEISYRLGNGFRVSLVPQIAPTQISIVRSRIGSSVSGQALLLLW